MPSSAQRTTTKGCSTSAGNSRASPARANTTSQCPGKGAGSWLSASLARDTPLKTQVFLPGHQQQGKRSETLPLLSVVSFLSDKLMASDAPSGICGGREEQTSMTEALMVPPTEPGTAPGRSRELGDAGAVTALPQTSSAPALPYPCSPAWKLAVTALPYTERVF